MTRNDLPATAVADTLLVLHGRSFGGKQAGKYRISRKFLRQLSGRRRLTEDFLRDVGDELFERGCVLVDLETHFAVLEQRLFNSYRRVTTAAATNLPVAVERGDVNQSREESGSGR